MELSMWDCESEWRSVSLGIDYLGWITYFLNFQAIFSVRFFGVEISEQAWLIIRSYFRSASEILGYLANTKPRSLAFEKS